MQKIVFLVNNFGGPGGIGTIQKHLVEELQKKYEIVFISRNNEKLADSFAEYNVREIHLNAENRAEIIEIVRNTEKIISIFSYVTNIFLDYLAEDRIFLQAEIIDFCFVDVGRITKQENFLAPDGYGILARLYDNRQYNPSKVLVLTEKSKEIMKVKYPHINFVVVPNLISFSDVTVRSFDERASFIFVGRITKEEKNLEALVNIFEGINSKLEIYGDGQDLEWLKGRISKLQNIKYCGFLKHDEVVQTMSNYKALINTSDSEGLPNVFYESFMAHTPVICFDSFITASEIVKNNENGYLIPKGNISLFKKAVVKLDHLTKDEFNVLKTNIGNEMQKYSFNDNLNSFMDNICSVEKKLSPGITVIHIDKKHEVIMKCSERKDLVISEYMVANNSIQNIINNIETEKFTLVLCNTNYNNVDLLQDIDVIKSSSNFSNVYKTRNCVSRNLVVSPIKKCDDVYFFINSINKVLNNIVFENIQVNINTNMLIRNDFAISIINNNKNFETNNYSFVTKGDKTVYKEYKAYFKEVI